MERTEDNKFPIIKSLEPMYATKEHIKRVYDIGTEIVITDEELKKRNIMDCGNSDGR